MVRWGGCTDVGKVRPVNEDGFVTSVCGKENSVCYALVADGMGGHQAGEVASKMAIAQISAQLNEKLTEAMSEADIKDLLGHAIKQANSAIYEKSRQDKSYYGMGTTLTICVISGDNAVVAHVGDSRTYLLRGGKLHQVTTDHSLVQLLLSRGQITEEEASTHPQKNVITRAVGTDSDIEIDIYEFSVCTGDLVLLSTDGLTNLLSAKDLLSLLKKRGKKEPAQVAESLVSEANSRGGTDNITAVLGFIE